MGNCIFTWESLITHYSLLITHYSLLIQQTLVTTMQLKKSRLSAFLAIIAR
ncbi:MAG: hypothetical protein F6K47_22745, partial [Symploca sp. SIO2E6]|nr:hypothetical protein [Symploca sp. SIO2E6]